MPPLRLLPASWGHMSRRAARSLWENLYLNTMAAGVIAAATLLMGVFLTVMFNLNAITAAWEQDVHISAYFHSNIPVERRFEIMDRVAAMEGVETVRYLSEEDARMYLVERVPEVAPVMEELGEQVLPASLEVTLVPSFARSEMVRELAGAMDFPELSEVDHGQQWVERFNTFLSLLRLLGVILGGLLSISAVFLVANAINLAVFNRREELETMRLVGATDGSITTPFILEGAVQGVVGGAAGILTLKALHIWVIAPLQAALELSLVDTPVRALPLEKLSLLLLAGALLAMTGSFIAVKRFLWRAP